MSGKFRKGLSTTGKVVEFRKGYRSFHLHARTRRKLRKIVRYFVGKGWRVAGYS